MLKDMLGNTLNTGDYILYTQQCGRSTSKIDFCRVAEISSKSNSYSTPTSPILRIERASQNHQGAWFISKPVIVHHPHLALKIPFDFLPPELKDVFKKEED